VPAIQPSEKQSKQIFKKKVMNLKKEFEHNVFTFLIGIIKHYYHAKFQVIWKNTNFLGGFYHLPIWKSKM